MCLKLNMGIFKHIWCETVTFEMCRGQERSHIMEGGLWYAEPNLAKAQVFKVTTESQ